MEYLPMGYCEQHFDCSTHPHHLIRVPRQRQSSLHFFRIKNKVKNEECFLFKVKTLGTIPQTPFFF